jgi:hypothetical protein
MATSAIPTLKKNLRDRLAARDRLSGVQLAYGWPKFETRRVSELLILGDVDFAQEPATIGTNRSREDDGELEVWVIVTQATTDQQKPTERAFALMAEVENELRTDPTVNNAVRIAQIGGDGELRELASDRERQARLLFHVRYEARI